MFEGGGQTRHDINRTDDGERIRTAFVVGVKPESGGIEASSTVEKHLEAAKKKR